MSNQKNSQILGYYINNQSEVRTVVQNQDEILSYTNIFTNTQKTPVKIVSKPEEPNIQIVQELQMKKNSGFSESEEFNLYPDIDTLWASFKVEVK